MKVSQQVQIRPSRYFAALMGASSMVAAFSILLSGLATALAAVFLLALAVLTLLSIRNDGFIFRKPRIAAIYWSEGQKSGDSWVLELANGQQLPVALSEAHSTLSGRLITLVFLQRDEGRWRSHRKLTTLLLPDSAAEEELRHLRVALNMLN